MSVMVAQGLLRTGSGLCIFVGPSFHSYVSPPLDTQLSSNAIDKDSVSQRVVVEAVPVLPVTEGMRTVLEMLLLQRKQLSHWRGKAPSRARILASTAISFQELLVVQKRRIRRLLLAL